jgi:hypothetical protein
MNVIVGDLRLKGVIMARSTSYMAFAKAEQPCQMTVAFLIEEHQSLDLPISGAIIGCHLGNLRSRRVLGCEL